MRCGDRYDLWHLKSNTTTPPHNDETRQTSPPRQHVWCNPSCHIIPQVTFFQKSPIFSHKSPIFSQNSPIRALYSLKTAPQEPYILEAPYIPVVTPHAISYPLSQLVANQVTSQIKSRPKSSHVSNITSHTGDNKVESFKSQLYPHPLF